MPFHLQGSAPRIVLIHFVMQTIYVASNRPACNVLGVGPAQNARKGRQRVLLFHAGETLAMPCNSGVHLQEQQAVRDAARYRMVRFAVLFSADRAIDLDNKSRAFAELHPLLQ